MATRTWNIRSQAWLFGAWEDLKPDELEVTFEKCLKDIAAAVRFFKDKELPKIYKNASFMKEKIDEFKPKVPLALSLRKEGM